MCGALRARSLGISLAAAAVSGALVTLSLPPLDAGPVAFVALVPILWAIREARGRRAALLGFVFGLVYLGILLLWLLSVTVLGWGVLVVGQAPWFALTLAYGAAIWRDDRPLRTAFWVAAGWTAIEIARGIWPLGGFTWGGLGATQHDNSLLLPLASVLGAWGISFVIVAVNALLLALLRAGEWRKRIVPTAAATALTLVPAAIPLSSPDGPPTDVAIVQGNVPKFVALGSRFIEDRIVAENHAELHRELARRPPDLAVWPENALDRDPSRDSSLGRLVRGSIRAVAAPTLIGAITTGEDGRLRNENLLYHPIGRVVSRYAKNHLVPFGEYVPFRRHLGFVGELQQVPRDLFPGSVPGRFSIPGATFASIICFENTFPDLVRQFVTDEMGFLVVSTNNSTFLRTPLSAQHLVMSELRAVENGRWVVHAAISGISAIIDYRGNVLAETALFEQTILRRDIPQAEGRTVFNVIGGWLPLGFGLLAMLGFLARPIRRRREPHGLPSRPRVAVVIPTYNEADTIAQVLERLRAVDDDLTVVVVDDSSSDGTGDIVREVGNRDARVQLIVRPSKGGLASAYADGFHRVLDAGADLIVEMDADLSHRPEELPGLLEAAGRHDLVIGSRYVSGGGVRNWGLVRRLLSRGGNLYARLLLGLPVTDATSGFRVFRREMLEHLLHEGVSSEGYAFQVELAMRTWLSGGSVWEAPITFDDRRAGHSKFSRRIIVEALWRILVWGLRYRLLPRSHAAQLSQASDRGQQT
ncbi:MAG: apolipoprotein N-acyltransferase [Actinomycetota bacterium]